MIGVAPLAPLVALFFALFGGLENQQFLVDYGLPFDPPGTQHVCFYLSKTMVFEKSTFRLLVPLGIHFGLLLAPFWLLLAPQVREGDWEIGRAHV